MEFKIWLESDDTTFRAYHQTSIELAKKIKRYGFSLKNSTQGIIWFTNNIEDLKNNNTGANASGAIIEVEVTINKAAGWKEYDNLLLMQLKSLGYDGAILPHGDGTFNGWVFSPKQIKFIRIVDQL